MIHHRGRYWAVTCGLTVILVASGTPLGMAQNYPVKPVRVIVVFPPGGSTDVVARVAFQKVADLTGQPFQIDNRAGAGGTLGAAIAAKSPADGYTLMVYSASLIANAHLYRKLPYDALRDFTGITPVSRLVGMLAVHPSLPVRNAKELLALAKSRPRELRYGSAGVGAYQHLAGSLFATMGGVSINHVPYKGGAQAAVATASGEIEMLLTPVVEVMSLVKSGRLRPIAVSSGTRTTQFPDVPALAESIAGYELVSWFGAFAPTGTPRPIIDRLNAELKKAVAEPEVSAKLSSLVLDPMHQTPEEFAKLLKADFDKYEQIVKQSGARLD